jgi:hypothetical protein
VKGNAATRERVELGTRDHALFQGLFEAGVMLRGQIADLYFGGSYEAANKRLQKLFKHGYLRERNAGERNGKFLPTWIALAEPAFRTLKNSGLVDEQFPWETIRRRLARSSATLLHDLGVVDLWVSFEQACRGSMAHRIKQFSTWPYQFQFEPNGTNGGGPSVLLPDAFALIAHTDDPALPPVESALFFEWDRSTEGRGVLRGKAIGYDQYYRSGAFAECQGGTRTDIDEYPFRTIFAVRNEERRNNLLEELARPSGNGALIHDQFWVTTWDEVLADPLGAIYLHVGDYVAAMKDTIYDPARFVTKYRVRDRDQLVREKVAQRRLFE